MTAICPHGRLVGACQFGCRWSHNGCCHTLVVGQPPREWVEAQERRPWWKKVLGIEVPA